MDAEEFLRCVANHEMTVLSDDGGVRRHLRFSKQGSRDQQFDLVTWPGHLCYTGDMGTYVFERVNDMFQFFPCDTGELRINPGYWGDKLLAADRHGGYEEWSKDRFEQSLRENLAYWLEDRPHWCEEDKQRGLEDFEDELTGWLELGAEHAYSEAARFEVGGFTPFEDLHESPCMEFTHHYLWCCYAVVWGIGKYRSSTREGE